MPPKVKITREDIISSGIEIIRKSGASAVNARSISALLGSSTQPIFSNFSSMQELNDAVLARAHEIYQEYLGREILSGKYPEYKATGMAYIGFSKDEGELFKLLFMRDRSNEPLNNEDRLFNSAALGIQKSLGISKERAVLFHLKMWTFVHGIATMMATNYLELDTELISQMITEIYQSQKMQEDRHGEFDSNR